MYIYIVISTHRIKTEYSAPIHIILSLVGCCSALDVPRKKELHIECTHDQQPTQPPPTTTSSRPGDYIVTTYTHSVPFVNNALAGFHLSYT